jgi:hypothetical protein
MQATRTLHLGLALHTLTYIGSLEGLKREWQYEEVRTMSLYIRKHLLT